MQLMCIFRVCKSVFSSCTKYCIFFTYKKFPDDLWKKKNSKIFIFQNLLKTIVMMFVMKRSCLIKMNMCYYIQKRNFNYGKVANYWAKMTRVSGY
ncbi:hypothetical protein GLOIN_2v1572312 [Rhizophagus irregularis DAOM 181602=DAOM 197198]|uniref:Uncharacterized protein n=1 Tax=Rhizophagus irregularis (strain DAOM 181602 / DAOM 197198 / MUCL 43194) TaxID=747089 RepID=A0A2P4QB64_RHIID|nr:hypothetical protein GLOIN_2v1572312 [Rhizophagus irregularis DAOM 181602=DAOM 197198]POG74882.1 hypothetical protein GLOIN_2v1572312 [Rhizophagus irregularis DAOM 181602=DAOM 197198]GBC30691.2 hypothetical protein GLOIN_2v1572312 [Rhizophagus irregularis DAOM 181602=DAOM 197198]|eukprot:XP_025181748.1 hypothetical protein GLOIN_2v1572312 [Rhizophagus irregularis DAOM 181602=DAOM 197198]